MFPEKDAAVRRYIQAELYLEKLVCSVEMHLQSSSIRALKELVDEARTARDFIDSLPNCRTVRGHDQREHEKENQSGETQRTDSTPH